MKSYCWEIYLTRVQAKLKRIKELEESLRVENKVIKNVGNRDDGQWHSSDDINQKLQYARSPDESANVSARTRSHAPARTRLRVTIVARTRWYSDLHASRSVDGRPSCPKDVSKDPRENRSAGLFPPHPPDAEEPVDHFRLLVSRGLSSSSVFPRQCYK